MASVLFARKYKTEE